jgi:hypothetical protein
MDSKALFDALQVFEKELYKAWDDYNLKLKELDTYRGVVIDDKNIAHINKILDEIQESMAVLWPSFDWVQQRAHKINQTVVAYNAFINDIVSAGAKEAQKGITH